MNKEKALKNQGLEFREDIVIGGGCEYTPGKGTRYMKCYKYLGKLYWVYV